MGMSPIITASQPEKLKRSQGHTGNGSGFPSLTSSAVDQLNWSIGKRDRQSFGFGPSSGCGVAIGEEPLVRSSLSLR